MMEKKGNLNLISKSYAFKVFCDSDVTFLGAEEDTAFYPILYCVLFIHNRWSMLSDFLVYQTSVGISLKFCYS